MPHKFYTEGAKVDFTFDPVTRINRVSPLIVHNLNVKLKVIGLQMVSVSYTERKIGT